MKKVRSNVFVEIWNSFRATPGWVQVWIVLLFMPINMASLFFLDKPMGMLIAFLANAGMLLNIPVTDVHTASPSVDCIGVVDLVFSAC